MRGSETWGEETCRHSIVESGDKITHGYTRRARCRATGYLWLLPPFSDAQALNRLQGDAVPVAVKVKFT
jgi:hypothetical protein